MFTSEEIQASQLRLSLLALHRQVLHLGHQRNYFILMGILTLVTGTVIYVFPLYPWPILTFVVPSFFLHKSYFIDLPKNKSVLAFFERNHPELCSWLPESALLEAAMIHEQKTA